jgi:hypothetical protein
MGLLEAGNRGHLAIIIIAANNFLGCLKTGKYSFLSMLSSLILIIKII